VVEEVEDGLQSLLPGSGSREKRRKRRRKKMEKKTEVSSLQSTLGDRSTPMLTGMKNQR